ncbi:2-aminoethylphosphonate ABC transport system ATP-binding subunit PhnT, partial [Streptomyces sp. SID625]|nr:2-aminoethylphosphonate ABC transport system ATP-binding subunit PhnT [Streptomyces sp. SID625]
MSSRPSPTCPPCSREPGEMSIRFDSVTVAYDGNVVLDSLDLT